MGFKNFLKLILVKQTLFALPFAFLGVAFGGGGGPKTWILTAAALAAARSAGMCFNMALDHRIDAKNPRTKDRLIPRGEVAPRQAWVWAWLSCLALIGSAFFLNRLCFYLSFPAVFGLFTYSFFKRFSASSHFYLGLVEAAAPIGGYLAAAGSFSAVPFALGVVIMAWIAGLDIVYALQDMEFDRKEKLHSVPAALGRKKALLVSALCHLVSLSAIVFAGVHTGRGAPYWIGALFVAAVFSRQQALAWRGHDAAQIQKIFAVNMYIAPALFLGAFIDILI
ncbi:4-hydroxybenzoate octaprenyltransferase [Candidatus Desulfarcum epimagneticum]|uniref:4-hydroxybenzoate polyprenyltransferase n=1 Tax=uncultured Desulfobacteraceae bacterium TaxID=218296 RepID=A0A484HDJ5_9BACT|nr:4-hydroxybenzoate octaprenyltransferase [uncultured Desulfobacteraceae bacterium]